MTGSRTDTRRAAGETPERRIAGALLALCLAMWTASAYAYPMYDNGSGVGCVSCHNQFQSGTGVLHMQHLNFFGITNCNVCHPSGGGSVPVLTYFSGPGGGYGCAGCHGVDYGEISPHSGEPKATSYGLRLVHVANGVTQCGTSGCHKPGTQGSPNPFPAVLPEHTIPPYYNPLYSSLTDPCSSAQEDLPFDMNTVGLDNDGDGFADYPADSDCPPPATPTITPSPTPTVGVACGTAPAVCIAPEKGSLKIDEKKPGKEKLKVTLTKLQSTVAQNQFGNPVSGSTSYAICIYDSANQLRGTYTILRAGDICGAGPCWSPISDKGYKYLDQTTTADGILKMKLVGGAAGKGKIKVIGKNTGGYLPTGVAALLQNQTSATVQVLSSDAACFGVGLSQVKKADGAIFSATGP